MSGDINVLYVPLDENGTNSATIALLNESITATLKDDLRSVGVIPISGKSGSFRVEFRTADREVDLSEDGVTRRDQLIDVARAYNADLVLSGLSSRSEAGLSVVNELLIRDDTSGEGAQVAGLYKSGSFQISPSGSAVDPFTRLRIRTDISTNVQNAASLISAIALYSHSEYKAAIDSLLPITGSSNELDDPTLGSLASLFVANSWGRLENYDRAAAEYRKSRQLDPLSLRPLIGLAELEYQSGHGSCAADDLARQILENNVRTYDSLLHYKEDERYVLEDVRPRASYGIGRARLCLGIGLGADQLIKMAASDFDTVFNFLRQGDGWRLPSLAAEAMENRSLADLSRRTPPTSQSRAEALTRYILAGRVSDIPSRKALFIAQAAILYKQLGNSERAAACYAEASRITSDQSYSPTANGLPNPAQGAICE